MGRFYAKRNVESSDPVNVLYTSLSGCIWVILYQNLYGGIWLNEYVMHLFLDVYIGSSYTKLYMDNPNSINMLYIFCMGVYEPSLYQMLCGELCLNQYVIHILYGCVWTLLIPDVMWRALSQSICYTYFVWVCMNPPYTRCYTEISVSINIL